MKVKLEYVWLDGYKPEPNLRSKVKIIEVNSKEDLENIPEWGFDGSSTKQAEGHFSDCYLKPVRGYVKSSISEYCTVYVLCEVLNSDGKPHETNDRANKNILFVQDITNQLLGLIMAVSLTFKEHIIVVLEDKWLEEV
jgi:hypothetical protein